MPLPTTQDTSNAYMYARDKILKTKCTSSQGLWVPDTDHNRGYKCPNGIECESGKCRVPNEADCLKRSATSFDHTTGEPRQPSGVQCSKDSDCSHLEGNVCSSETKQCADARTFVEWVGGKCVRGNEALYKFCELPSTRDFASDVPKLTYVKGGDCLLTHEYCNRMGTDFKAGPPPDCYVSDGQWVGELLMGKTIFRGFKKAFNGFDNDPSPPPPPPPTPTEPPKDLKLVGPNFGGQGINLYMDQHSGKAVLKPQEVREKYPNFVSGNDILITKEDVQRLPELKRMFLVINNGQVLGKHVAPWM